MKPEEGAVASELYTAEAGESRARAEQDQGVPDPTEEEARAAIAAATLPAAGKGPRATP